jgi:hypothetical protein
MASKIDERVWETFLRRPSDLKEGVETAMVLRDVRPGKKKYQMCHVIAIVSRKPEDMVAMDLLRVRTVVGILLGETWGIRILKDLPTELPGIPYHDFFEALRKASATGA